MNYELKYREDKSMKKILVAMAAIMLLTGCVEQRRYDEQVRKADSLLSECIALRNTNKVLQQELDGYKYAP